MAGAQDADLLGRAARQIDDAAGDERTAIEQFRREIGKYVDEAEVARLERYVTIRN